jgi:hypothetical protein
MQNKEVADGQGVTRAGGTKFAAWEEWIFKFISRQNSLAHLARRSSDTRKVPQMKCALTRGFAKSGGILSSRLL